MKTYQVTREETQRYCAIVTAEKGEDAIDRFEALFAAGNVPCCVADVAYYFDEHEE